MKREITELNAILATVKQDLKTSQTDKDALEQQIKVQEAMTTGKEKLQTATQTHLEEQLASQTLLNKKLAAEVSALSPIVKTPQPQRAIFFLGGRSYVFDNLGDIHGVVESIFDYLPTNLRFVKRGGSTVGLPSKALQFCAGDEWDIKLAVALDKGTGVCEELLVDPYGSLESVLDPGDAARLTRSTFGVKREFRWLKEANVTITMSKPVTAMFFLGGALEKQTIHVDAYTTCAQAKAMLGGLCSSGTLLVTSVEKVAPWNGTARTQPCDCTRLLDGDTLRLGIGQVIWVVGCVSMGSSTGWFSSVDDVESAKRDCCSTVDGAAHCCC